MKIIPLTIAALLLAPLAALHAAPQPTARPNILLVMADDQGWGDTGYNEKWAAVLPPVGPSFKDTTEGDENESEKKKK